MALCLPGPSQKVCLSFVSHGVCVCVCSMAMAGRSCVVRACHAAVGLGERVGAGQWHVRRVRQPRRVLPSAAAPARPAPRSKPTGRCQREPAAVGHQRWPAEPQVCNGDAGCDQREGEPLIHSEQGTGGERKHENQECRNEEGRLRVSCHLHVGSC